MKHPILQMMSPIPKTTLLKIAFGNYTMLLANVMSWNLWYALPLIISISLVYGATRHELLTPILIHAWRSLTWIVGFMAIIYAVLFFAGWGL
jgi:hypothetical protein